MPPPPLDQTQLACWRPTSSPSLLSSHVYIAIRRSSNGLQFPIAVYSTIFESCVTDWLKPIRLSRISYRQTLWLQGMIPGIDLRDTTPFQCSRDFMTLGIDPSTHDLLTVKVLTCQYVALRACLLHTGLSTYQR
jgi:hypothetical protein